MQIAIIGAGNIGAALAARLTRLGHNVTIANSRGPDTLRDVADRTGALAAYAPQATEAAQLVVVTVPMKRVPDLPDDLLDGAHTDAIVIDTCNYYPRERDGRIDPIEQGATESRWVSDEIGHPVVKAFNNIYAEHLRDLGRPAGDPERIALPIAADEQEAKTTVMHLVDDLGFDTVDAGTIDDSWRQQPGTPVYGTDHDAPGVSAALAAADRQRPSQFTA